MTDFKVKMHQIRFRLGLRPRPCCMEELTALPQTLLLDLGVTSRQGEGLGWGREGEGEVGEVKGRERKGPKLLLNQSPQSLATPLAMVIDITGPW